MNHAVSSPPCLVSSSAVEPARSPSRIVVGIDPGLDEHGVVALHAATCTRLHRRPVGNTLAGFQQLAALLRQWQAACGGALTIALEDACNYGEALAHFLRQEGFDLVTVCPFKVARFREALGVDANDLADAEAVARFVIVQPDLPRRPTIGESLHGSAQHQLRQLARRHQRWTRERTAACNELHALLRKAWLADYQRFFSDIHGAAALAVWQAYPTPTEAAQADPVALAALIRQASRGAVGAQAAEKKAQELQATARLMKMVLGKNDPQRWQAWAQDIRMVARHIVHQNEALRETDRRMQELLERLNSPLLSFAGMGPVTAATLHGETLSIERFATSGDFARYNGTAPREQSSGRTPRFVKNQRCNRHLRQALMQLALNALKHQPASKAYHQRLAARGIGGQAARIRLARRLSDIVYAMLRDHRPYDLEYYLTRKVEAA